MRSHEVQGEPVTGYEGAIIEENGWNISKRARQCMVLGAIFISCLIIYCFCFVLPQAFIPEGVPLHEIAKIKKLDVSLRPVLTEQVSHHKIQSSNDRISRSLDDSKDIDNLYIKTQSILDFKVSPQGSMSKQKDRLILVGDIHGQQKELHELLKKIQFNNHSDTLVVLGDFISKGPKSIEVIDDLIELDAKCILGNHEYYVLQNYAIFHGLAAPEFENASSDYSDSAIFRDLQSENSFNDDPEYLLAKRLQPRHVKYINQCPIMLDLGPVPLHSKKNDGDMKSGQGIAVHAGLRWDLTKDLNEQDPIECLHMRSLLAPNYTESTEDSTLKHTVSWSKIWNAKHKEGAVDDNYVVYYGHDAHRGLNLKRWAKGLDSGCTKGGSLTAMVIWQEKSSADKTMFKEKIVSVDC